jgi:hypothetical protein
MEKPRQSGLLDDGSVPSFVIAGLLGGNDGADQPQQLPEIDVGPSSIPGDAAHEFVRQQLQSGEAQQRQYDPQAGLITALDFARWTPGAGAVKAFGLYPDGKGGYLPSMREDLTDGRPIAAVLDALGIAIPAYRGVSKGLRFFDVRQPPKK